MIFFRIVNSSVRNQVLSFTCVFQSEIVLDILLYLLQVYCRFADKFIMKNYK